MLLLAQAQPVLTPESLLVQQPERQLGLEQQVLLLGQVQAQLPVLQEQQRHPNRYQ